MADKVRFSVIGTGKMGMRRIRAIVNHHAAKLVCVCDKLEERAKAVAGEVGVPYVVDYESAVAREDVDCVVICLPNSLHCAVATLAAEAGKHIFCEKPLARTPTEAQAMVDLTARAGVILKVGSNLRYFPNVQKAKELISQNVIGRIQFLRGWIGNDGGHLRGSWYREAEQIGGGTLLDNGCHLFDIARWFMGEVLTGTGGVGNLYWSDIAIEDNGMGIFRFANGALAYVQCSWSEWKGYAYFEVYGTEGFLHIDCRGPACKLVRGDRRGAEELFDYSDLPPQSYEMEFDHFITCLREGRQPEPSGADGLQAVKMAAAVYEASATGRAVSITPAVMGR